MNDLAEWIALLEMVEHEMPFLTQNRAIAYFETELLILEGFLKFLENNPELDG